MTLFSSIPQDLPRVIVLVGPTASGKTALAIDLARRYSGEIIAADSRTLYRGMDIGTGKPSRNTEQHSVAGCSCSYISGEIPHHLIDIVEPDAQFTMVDFKKKAEECLDSIIARGKVPFVVGGTGLYIKSLVDDLRPSAVMPDAKVRAQLEENSLVENARRLAEIAPDVAGRTDLKNPRRVIRALEVALGNPVSDTPVSTQKYVFLQLGLSVPRAELCDRIDRRIDDQLERGLVDEVLALEHAGYGWSLSSMSGIGYRQVGYYLRGEATLDEAVRRLRLDTKQYARRQMTWFRCDQRIVWLEKKQQPLLEEAAALINQFLANPGTTEKV